MESYGLDETKEEKPELRLVGPQIALAKIAEPKVGQRYRLVAECVIDEVHDVTMSPEEEFNKPYVCFKLERLEMESKEPDPMDAVRRLYPSSALPAPVVLRTV